MNEEMTIGELGRHSGVKVVTIRYYERAGLMPAPRRTKGNYRSYRREHLHRLRFIRRLRDLGFTLDQARDLLCLASDGQRACDEVVGMTRDHLATVEAKIRDLERLAGELRRLIGCCAGGNRVTECGIIEALSSRGG